MIDGWELDRRFSYHPPVDSQRAADHERVRAACRRLAAELVLVVPEGRELAVALTSVEEAMMWANAGLARPAPSLFPRPGFLPAAPAEPRHLSAGEAS